MLSRQDGRREPISRGVTPVSRGSWNDRYTRDLVSLDSHVELGDQEEVGEAKEPVALVEGHVAGSYPRSRETGDSDVTELEEAALIGSSLNR